MQTIGLIIIEILLIGASVFGIRYTLHMFQLNSYQYKSHWRFMKSHIVQSFFPLLLIIALILDSQGFTIMGLILAIVLAIGMIFLYLPRTAKKKLVYTPRVKRLIATTVILECIVLLLTRSISMVAAICVFTVLLANICNQPIEKGINQHYINDARKMLKACSNLKIIGITGSYGKTSVKYYLHTLLSAQYDVLMTPESYNTPMGVVKTIRSSLRATHEIFLCEMGARHVGDIQEICDIVDPQIGIITSLGPQHLETFKSIDNIVNTKTELFRALPSEAPYYINGDNKIVQEYGLKQGAITYGLESDSTYRAYDLEYSEKGAKFKVIAPDGSIGEFQTKLLGEHNVVNITGAIAIAHDLGIPLDKLKLPVRRLEGAPHRLQPIARGNITIIDDAYNSNPNGATVALQTLHMFEGIKVLVTPGMVELGEQEDQANYEFGIQATKYCDYIVLVGKKQTESIQRGVESTSFETENYYVAENLQDALKYVYSIVTTQKLIVLLENDLPDNYL